MKKVIHILALSLVVTIAMSDKLLAQQYEVRSGDGTCGEYYGIVSDDVVVGKIYLDADEGYAGSCFYTKKRAVQVAWYLNILEEKREQFTKLYRHMAPGEMSDYGPCGKKGYAIVRGGKFLQNLIGKKKQGNQISCFKEQNHAMNLAEQINKSTRKLNSLYGFDESDPQSRKYNAFHVENINTLNLKLSRKILTCFPEDVKVNATSLQKVLEGISFLNMDISIPKGCPVTKKLKYELITVTVQIKPNDKIILISNQWQVDLDQPIDTGFWVGSFIEPELYKTKK